MGWGDRCTLPDSKEGKVIIALRGEVEQLRAERYALQNQVEDLNLQVLNLSRNATEYEMQRDELQAKLDKVREPLSSAEIDKSYDFSGGTTRYSLASGIHRAIIDRLEE